MDLRINRIRINRTRPVATKQHCFRMFLKGLLFKCRNMLDSTNRLQAIDAIDYVFVSKNWKINLKHNNSIRYLIAKFQMIGLYSFVFFKFVKSCGPDSIGVDLVSDANWDWIKIWLLNTFVSLIVYVAARSAAKVWVQVPEGIFSFSNTIFLNFKWVYLLAIKLNRGTFGFKRMGKFR